MAKRLKRIGVPHRVNSDGTITVIAAVRRLDGTPTHISGNQLPVGLSKDDYLVEYLRIKREWNTRKEMDAAGGSLTSPVITLRYLIDRYARNRGDGGMAGAFATILKHEIADTPIGKDFAAHLDEFYGWLRTTPFKGPFWKHEKMRSQGTIGKIMAAARVVLRYGVEIGKLDTVPIKKFVVHESAELDITLTDEQWLALWNHLVQKQSYLRWAIWFSRHNVIRKKDLLALERANYKVNDREVQFYASKTRKKKPQLTYLIGIDDLMHNYFTRILPPDCPILFPKINDDGTWEPMPDFEQHFKTMLKHVGIKNFTWHSLKHCAETLWATREGFSIHHMRALGWQHSEKMMQRYVSKKNLADELRRKMRGDSKSTSCSTSKIETALEAAWL